MLTPGFSRLGDHFVGAPLTNESILIKVVNWEEYNPRSDVRRPSWFRMDNDMALGPGLHGLDADQKWLWVVLLSLTSRKNGAEITWNTSYVQATSGMRPDRQIITLEIFEKLGLTCMTRTSACKDVTYSHADVTSTSRTRTLRDGTGRTGRDERTNERDEDSPERSNERVRTVSDYLSLSGIFEERGVSEEVQQRWVLAFPDPLWVISEVNQALAWEASHPTRRKKNFPAFITRWLTKDWDLRKTPYVEPKLDFSWMKDLPQKEGTP